MFSSNFQPYKLSTALVSTFEVFTIFCACVIKKNPQFTFTFECIYCYNHLYHLINFFVNHFIYSLYNFNYVLLFCLSTFVSKYLMLKVFSLKIELLL